MKSKTKKFALIGAIALLLVVSIVALVGCSGTTGDGIKVGDVVYGNRTADVNFKNAEKRSAQDTVTLELLVDAGTTLQIPLSATVDINRQYVGADTTMNIRVRDLKFETTSKKAITGSFASVVTGAVGNLNTIAVDLYLKYNSDTDMFNGMVFVFQDGWTANTDCWTFTQESDGGKDVKLSKFNTFLYGGQENAERSAVADLMLDFGRNMLTSASLLYDFNQSGDSFDMTKDNRYMALMEIARQALDVLKDDHVDPNNEKSQTVDELQQKIAGDGKNIIDWLLSKTTFDEVSATIEKSGSNYSKIETNQDITLNLVKDDINNALDILGIFGLDIKTLIPMDITGILDGVLKTGIKVTANIKMSSTFDYENGALIPFPTKAPSYNIQEHNFDWNI